MRDGAQGDRFRPCSVVATAYDSLPDGSSRGRAPAPNRKSASRTARVLAPLALLTAVAAIVVVVIGSLDSSEDEGRGGDQQRAQVTSGCRPDAENAVEAGYYVIEVGEEKA